MGADLVMVAAGYLAEYSIIKAKNPEDQARVDLMLYLLGFVGLGVVLFYVNRWIQFLKSEDVDVEYIEVFFYAGWVLYGLNFLSRNEELRQTAFNLLDLFNKPIYSLQLERIMKSQF